MNVGGRLLEKQMLLALVEWLKKWGMGKLTAIVKFRADESF